MKQLDRQVLSGLVLIIILLVSLAHGAVPSEAQEADAAVSADGERISRAQASALTKHLVGKWVGARLLCRKEEDNAVRCGKPVEFTVYFSHDGTGTSTDEHFPNSFKYRWKSKSELTIISVPGGDELSLFQLAIEEGFLNFQTYIYLASRNPSLPREASYIHYIFDVHRLE